MSDDFDFDAFLNDIKNEMDEEPGRSSQASRAATGQEPRQRQREAARSAASARSRASRPSEPQRRAPTAARSAGSTRAASSPKRSASGSRKRRKGSGKRRVIIAIVAVLALIGIFGGNGKEDETLDRSVSQVVETEAPTITAEPTATPLPTDTPEPTARPTPSPEPERDYVLNTNTGVFHWPSCSSVSRMSEGNKWYYTGTRSSVVEMGYDPCDRCKP